MGSQVSTLVSDLQLPISIIAALNVIVYLVHGMPNKSDKYYDTTGATSYFVATLVSIFKLAGGPAAPTRTKLIAACVLLWCARLGSFLLQRIMRDGRDRRMDLMKSNRALFL